MTDQQIYETIQRHYPTIAGRVIALQLLGETNAEAEWLQVAQDFNRILTEWKGECPATEPLGTLASPSREE